MFEDTVMPEGMSPEVLEHLMFPKNYGKLDTPTCVGIAMDEKTNEYVIFYLNLTNEHIDDVKFATNGCQDTVVIGSMFSDMILGNDTTYAQTAIQKMYEKLGNMSAQQKVCAEIVFSSFVAAMLNRDNREAGKDEEVHVLKMKESCDLEGKKDE